jgi:hypothetical protein
MSQGKFLLPERTGSIVTIGTPIGTKNLGKLAAFCVSLVKHKARGVTK